MLKFAELPDRRLRAALYAVVTNAAVSRMRHFYIAALVFRPYGALSFWRLPLIRRIRVLLVKPSGAGVDPISSISWLKMRFAEAHPPLLSFPNRGRWVLGWWY